MDATTTVRRYFREAHPRLAEVAELDGFPGFFLWGPTRLHEVRMALLITTNEAGDALAFPVHVAIENVIEAIDEIMGTAWNVSSAVEMSLALAPTKAVWDELARSLKTAAGEAQRALEAE